MANQITGVPSELEAYTGATTGSTFALDSTATSALNAIRNFNAANVVSDVPGAIDDVASGCSQTAERLRDHDRIPAGFASALVALDSDGVASPSGTYEIDRTMSAFVPFLVQARVDSFYADPASVFDTALATFDPGFAATYRTLRDGDPGARPIALWAPAITEQAIQDARALALFAEGRIPPDSPEYAEIAGRVGWLDERSERFDGYAQTLYIDELGAEGVEVLDMFGTYAAIDASDGEINGPDVRGDLLMPFAAGFAVAARYPAAAPMIEQLADVGTNPMRARNLAMLASGAPQPAPFLVAAADAILIDSAAYIDTRIGMAAIGDNGEAAILFGAGLPSSLDIVIVEALAGNAEASEDFAGLGEEQVRALVFGSRLSYFDEDRYILGASTVLDNAINLSGNLDDPDTQASNILLNVIRVADGDVPDLMKERLAGLAAGAMGSIQDYITVEGDYGDQMRRDVQDFFQELSYNDQAVNLLTLGALDQYQVDMQGALRDFASLSPAQQAVVANLNDYLETGTSDGRVLLGTLGAAFDDAKVAEEARHKAVTGALDFLGGAATGVGLASVPLTGGTGVLVGLGVTGVVDLGLNAFGDAIEPDNTDAEDFVNDVRPGVEQLTAKVLYDNGDMRDFLVQASNSGADPRTMTFATFSDLVAVENLVSHQGEVAENGTLLQVLRNGYFR